MKNRNGGAGYNHVSPGGLDGFDPFATYNLAFARGTQRVHARSAFGGEVRYLEGDKGGGGGDGDKGKADPPVSVSVVKIGDMSLDDVKGRLTHLRSNVEEAFKDGVENVDADTAKDIKAWNDEMHDLGERYDSLMELSKIRRDAIDDARKLAGPGVAVPAQKGGKGEPVMKTAGQMFADSDVLKAYLKDGVTGVDSPVSLKGFLSGKGTLGEDSALADVDGAYDPESLRLPGIQAPDEQANLIIGMFPAYPTTQAAIPFMKETTTTSGAVETNEGAAAGESTLAFTESSVSVRKISTILPVTDEVLSDVNGLRAYVDGRLRLFAEQRLDSQLVAGNGVAPNVEGVLNFTGLQTQAKGADPVFDAIFKGMTLVETVAFLMADGIAMHPTDWQGIRLTRTADGIYILGNPGDTAPKRLFGLPVTTSTRVTLNTAIVGDFAQGAAIYYRDRAEISISDSNQDYFEKDTITLKVRMRIAFVPFREAAFVEVTGI